MPLGRAVVAARLLLPLLLCAAVGPACIGFKLRVFLASLLLEPAWQRRRRARRQQPSQLHRLWHAQ